jgi:hypothetical protein
LKKYISILFLLILSSATYFINASYQWQIKQVKRSIKKALAEGAIDYDKVVVFRKSEIDNAVWVEPREFRLNGNMYDVFKTDTLENDLVYHSFLDDKEGAWVELLLAFSDSGQPLKAGKDFSPLKYLMKDLISESLQFVVCSSQFIADLISSDDIMIQQSFIRSVFSPPEGILFS